MEDNMEGCSEISDTSLYILFILILHEPIHRYTPTHLQTHLTIQNFLHLHNCETPLTSLSLSLSLSLSNLMEEAPPSLSLSLNFEKRQKGSVHARARVCVCVYAGTTAATLLYRVDCRRCSERQK